MEPFPRFEEIVGHTFRNRELLAQAFTHRSYLNEHRDIGRDHNERLEFLGDAVVELAVTDHLYHTFPEATEGDLTSYRAALVNAITLSSVAQKLSMNDFLLLSRGEAKDTGRARQFILANTFEAFVGALFVDQGYEAAQKFIADNLFGLMDDILKNKLWLDSKSAFQEQAQERAGTTPSYQTLEETGPDHDKHFTVGVYIGDVLVASGKGRSKQEAERPRMAGAECLRGGPQVPKRALTLAWRAYLTGGRERCLF
jgi:ribonuclease-3